VAEKQVNVSERVQARVDVSLNVNGGCFMGTPSLREGNAKPCGVDWQEYQEQGVHAPLGERGYP
jgi:hypothetical protein